jgi:hypothetical protein
LSQFGKLLKRRNRHSRQEKDDVSTYTMEKIMNTKKQRPFLLFVLVTLLSIMPFIGNSSMVQAQTKGAVIVETKYEDRRGSIMNIAVYVDNVANLAGGSFDLQFDSAVLTARSVTPGDLLKDAQVVDNIQNGSVKVAWAASSGRNDNGTLVEIEFRLNTRDGNSKLSLHDVELFNADVQKIAIETLNGQIKPFDGSEQKASSIVPSNKQWNISFNNAVHPSSVSHNSVYVVDKDGKRVTTKTTLSTDHRQLTVQPVGSYSPGTYSMFITEQVHTPNGQALNKPTKMEFTVE